ncbi:hypothetical protein PAPYR_4852 [Paratrimastix pyriformis]|uniref:F-box domain-containing protein n=1 Tax=Paratrimastix pyriformis TaxID=342808 RepID=A0ABQ8UJA7_9EUKA|nr:hypothetical protein PAPYR_4852 [Paratrimastix pyriformis]
MGAPPSRTSAGHRGGFSKPYIYIQLLSLSHAIRARIWGTLRELSFVAPDPVLSDITPTAEALAALVGPCKSLRKLAFPERWRNIYDHPTAEEDVFGAWVDEAFGGHTQLAVLTEFPTLLTAPDVERILGHLPGLAMLTFSPGFHMSAHILAALARCCPGLQALPRCADWASTPVPLALPGPLSGSLKEVDLREWACSEECLPALVSRLSAVTCLKLPCRCPPAALEPIASHLTALVLGSEPTDADMPGPWLCHLETLSLLHTLPIRGPLARLLAANQATLRCLSLQFDSSRAAGGLSLLVASLRALPHLARLNLVVCAHGCALSALLPPDLVDRLERLAVSLEAAEEPPLRIASRRLRRLRLDLEMGPDSGLALHCPALVALNLNARLTALQCPRLRTLKAPAQSLDGAAPMPDLEAIATSSWWGSDTDPPWTDPAWLLAGSSTRLRMLSGVRLTRPDLLASLGACGSLVRLEELCLDVAPGPVPGHQAAQVGHGHPTDNAQASGLRGGGRPLRLALRIGISVELEGDHAVGERGEVETHQLRAAAQPHPDGGQGRSPEGQGQVEQPRGLHLQVEVLQLPRQPQDERVGPSGGMGDVFWERLPPELLRTIVEASPCPLYIYLRLLSLSHAIRARIWGTLRELSFVAPDPVLSDITPTAEALAALVGPCKSLRKLAFPERWRNIYDHPTAEEDVFGAWVDEAFGGHTQLAVLTEFPTLLTAPDVERILGHLPGLAMLTFSPGFHMSAHILAALARCCPGLQALPRCADWASTPVPLALPGPLSGSLKEVDLREWACSEECLPALVSRLSAVTCLKLPCRCPPAALEPIASHLTALVLGSEPTDADMPGPWLCHLETLSLLHTLPIRACSSTPRGLPGLSLLVASLRALPHLARLNLVVCAHGCALSALLPPDLVDRLERLAVSLEAAEEPPLRIASRRLRRLRLDLEMGPDSGLALHCPALVALNLNARLTALQCPRLRTLKAPAQSLDGAAPMPDLEAIATSSWWGSDTDPPWTDPAWLLAGSSTRLRMLSGVRLTRPDLLASLGACGSLVRLEELCLDVAPGPVPGHQAAQVGHGHPTDNAQASGLRGGGRPLRLALRIGISVELEGDHAVGERGEVETHQLRAAAQPHPDGGQGRSPEGQGQVEQPRGLHLQVEVLQLPRQPQDERVGPSGGMGDVFWERLPPELLRTIVEASPCPLYIYLRLLSLSHAIRARIWGTLRELSFVAPDPVLSDITPTAEALAALVGPCKSLRKLAFPERWRNIYDHPTAEEDVFGAWVDEAFGGHTQLAVLTEFPTLLTAPDVERILGHLPGLAMLTFSPDPDISAHILAPLARCCPGLQVLRFPDPVGHRKQLDIEPDWERLAAPVGSLSALTSLRMRRCPPAALEPIASHLTALALLAANCATLRCLTLKLGPLEAPEAPASLLVASLRALTRLTRLNLVVNYPGCALPDLLPPDLVGRLERLNAGFRGIDPHPVLRIASRRLERLRLHVDEDLGPACWLALDCPALVELDTSYQLVTLQCPRLRTLRAPAQSLDGAAPMPHLGTLSHVRLTRPDLLARLCASGSLVRLKELRLDVPRLPNPLVLRLPGQLEQLDLILDDGGDRRPKNEPPPPPPPPPPPLDLQVEAPGLRDLALTLMGESMATARVRLHKCPRLVWLDLSSLGPGSVALQLGGEGDEAGAPAIQPLRLALGGALAFDAADLVISLWVRAADDRDWPRLMGTLSGLPRLARLALGLDVPPEAAAPPPVSLACPQLRQLTFSSLPDKTKVALACPLLEELRGVGRAELAFVPPAPDLRLLAPGSDDDGDDREDEDERAGCGGFGTEDPDPIDDDDRRLMNAG